MTHLHVPLALLPDGWAERVRVRIDEKGTIREVTPDAPAAGAVTVAGVAVPGVPNLHSHAFQRALAGLTERGTPGGDSFWGWRERMYAFLARLQPADVEVVARQLFAELLRHGYTAVAEFHYLRNDPQGRPYDDSVEMARRILAAARGAGMGVTLLPVLYQASDFGGAPPGEAQRRFVTSVDETLDDVARLHALGRDDPQTSVGLALHSLRAVPPEALRAALEGADAVAEGCPVHIHVAEQEREVDACVAWSGRRPVSWLLEHAPVGPRWCLVHATHMDDDEVEGVAASGAVVGLCPTTEANLGDGIFRLPAFQAARGAWGVGTDSHVSVSPAADLRLLEYGQRLRDRARNVVSAGRDASSGRMLLEAAWAGGAQACGRPLGRIAPGCRADLVFLDPSHPALAGREGDALLDAWIFSGEDTPVRDVMVGGRWVVEDGRHLRGEETARAYAQVARNLTA